jgi:tRNA-Thr(GGU) m(6)t(6)A37 methyltransferase TsaA
MNEILYKPIGIIHTKFEEIKDMPIQPAGAIGVTGTVEIYPDYAAGLKDIDGFSHIILIYYFHLSNGYQLEVKPFLDDNLHGVFATRAPKRPNNIGLSVVKLIKVENNILYIENVDILNDTPLIDIKPYVPDFDAVNNVRTGWLSRSKHKASAMRADDRFDFYF